MKQLDWARSVLNKSALRITEDPQTNSIASLAHAMLIELETGELGLDHVEAMIADLHLGALTKRAGKLREQHNGLDPETLWARVDARLAALAEGSFEAFSAAISRIAGGIVFTAHPTFAMPLPLHTAVVTHVTQATDESQNTLKDAITQTLEEPRTPITLADEHDATQIALQNAQTALGDLYTRIFAIAREAYPEDWQTLRPRFVTLASWVGYDLDGRTDIHWSQTIAFRLQEKATQLGRWAEQVDSLATDATGEAASALNTLARDLKAAADLTTEHGGLFTGDLSEDGVLATAANALTKDDPARITQSSQIAERLRKIGALDGAPLNALHVLAASVEMTALGTAHIHLRLNAAQIRTLIRRDLGLETEDRQLGRLALKKLAELVKTTDARQTNFADLFLEQSTARRQFMLCAQILKHIDAESPIRFLIAESENPATLMGALYLARQYGVDHALDLSPLFETPEALERGGRFIERLLEEPDFISYVEGRGRLSIQLGFSDSGRFIGQPASQMAIERIHSLIGRALAEKGLDIDLLIFNTHGESMGRGAYPGTFKQRFDHLLTPWVRSNFADTGLKHIHEVSFQGGDGFLHFSNPVLARSSVAAFCEHLLEPTDKIDDPFYTRTDFIWDFYRSVRNWQEGFFNNRDYHRVLSAFAPNFLLKTGSRQARRSGARATGVPTPRALRAIPQNAILHQLGIPLNTVSAIGSGVNHEMERFVDLANASPRLRDWLLLAVNARMVTSLPALRAYAKVYDPGYWSARSKYGKDDPARAAAHQRLGRYFAAYTVTAAMHRTANLLGVDLQRFDQIIDQLPDVPSTEARHAERVDLHVLHAIRQALMMQAFTLVAGLPDFAPRHDTTRRDLLTLISAWRVPEVVDRLCTVFPMSLEDGCLTDELVEAGHMHCDDDRGYSDIHAQVIQPLSDIARLSESITLAVCHHYGAYG